MEISRVRELIPSRPDSNTRITDWAFDNHPIAVETDETGPLDVTDTVMNAAVRDEPGARELARDFFAATEAERRVVFLEWIMESADA